MNAVKARRPATSTTPQPTVREMPAQKMAVVETVGDPIKVGKQAIGALYGSVYTLKFARKKEGKDFKVAPLRARWGDWQKTGKRNWHGEWAIPIPQDVKALPQKQEGVTVRPRTWKYGKVAEILHLGPYSAETPSIKRLRDFIAANGYEVTGEHEEEYLSRPTARVPKTLIRYRIKRPRRTPPRDAVSR